MCVSQVAVLVESGAISIIASISGMCALQNTANSTAFWVGYSGACPARYRDYRVGSPPISIWSRQEKARAVRKAVSTTLRRNGPVGLATSIRTVGWTRFYSINRNFK